LNSTPQLLACERRAVAQGAQLGPGDLRMDAAGEAAVSAGDDANKPGISPAGIYPVTTKGGTRSRSELRIAFLEYAFADSKSWKHDRPGCEQSLCTKYDHFF